MFTNTVSRDISFINTCFKNAENNLSLFDISQIKYNEFSKISKQANKMILRRKKSEVDKNHIQRRLNLQREQSPLAHIGWSFDNKILEWNTAAEKMFGYSKEEAIGKGTELIIPENEKKEVDKLLQNLSKDNNEIKHTNKNITKEGQIVTCEWYNNNLIDNGGNILGIVSIGFDITDVDSSKLLSEIILEETGNNVSYNTIRRFFGLVKSVKPRIYTLDIF
jgi:PAS domain S-box-containing protein